MPEKYVDRNTFSERIGTAEPHPQNRFLVPFTLLITLVSFIWEICIDFF